MGAGENVVIVDKHDNVLGEMEKMEAHRKGVLHRAFSVFVFNSKEELLIHQRAFGKYHSGGLWTNTCCSHPRMGENIEAAAHRRLGEEMGFDCPLAKAFEFTYKAEFENGLIEHEFDHVFLGYFEGNPHINPDEAANFDWINLGALNNKVAENPNHYTEWFKLILPKLGAFLQDEGRLILGNLKKFPEGPEKQA